MKITKLEENLYEVHINSWRWSPKKGLIEALKQLASEGKSVTEVIRIPPTWNYVYLILTK